jgi:hypothetical protein
VVIGIDVVCMEAFIKAGLHTGAEDDITGSGAGIAQGGVISGDPQVIVITTEESR